MAKRPIQKPDLSHQDRYLDDAEVLMDMGLTQQQALETLAVFHDLNKAILVVDAYRNRPEGIEVPLGSYDQYLTNLIDVLQSPSPTGSETIYDDEVAARTSVISQHQLHQEHYRDRPWDSDHFYEHQATRDLDKS